MGAERGEKGLAGAPRSMPSPPLAYMWARLTSSSPLVRAVANAPSDAAGEQLDQVPMTVGLIGIALGSGC